MQISVKGEGAFPEWEYRNNGQKAVYFSIAYVRSVKVQ